MPVFGDQDYPEEIRLKYRFLDLRREKLHANIMKRGADHRLDPPPHEGAGLLRVPDADPDRLLARRRARLPGAVALHPGKFYALPQAPQQFKQLIMMRASTATSRSRPASATRTPAPTARPASSTSSTSR
jgi:aspartyl-tRNA synthetase